MPPQRDKTLMFGAIIQLLRTLSLYRRLQGDVKEAKR
jgi:hypothetical protein